MHESTCILIYLYLCTVLQYHRVTVLLLHSEMVLQHSRAQRNHMLPVPAVPRRTVLDLTIVLYCDVLREVTRHDVLRCVVL